MSQLDLKTHHFEQRGGQSRLVRVAPYVRLFAEGQEIYIQNGQFYSAGGPSIPKNKLPKWVDAAVAELNPEVKAEVGLAASCA
jgi:hypothetical protein